MSFASNELLAGPGIPIQINFPKNNSSLKVQARLVWKRDTESGESVYAVEFDASGIDGDAFYIQVIIEGGTSAVGVDLDYIDIYA